MAIRIILALLLLTGGAITVWAQLGGSALLGTTYYLIETLKDPARTTNDPEVQGQIRALTLHEQLWRAVTYSGLVVFGLAASGLFVVSKAKPPSQP